MPASPEPCHAQAPWEAAGWGSVLGRPAVTLGLRRGQLHIPGPMGLVLSLQGQGMTTVCLVSCPHSPDRAARPLPPPSAHGGLEGWPAVGRLEVQPYSGHASNPEVHQPEVPLTPGPPTPGLPSPGTWVQGRAWTSTRLRRSRLWLPFSIHTLGWMDGCLRAPPALTATPSLQP